MITLEEKLNTCLQAIAASDDASWRKAVEDARKILDEEAENPVPTGERIRYEIESAFAKIGIPCSLIGYDYVIEAITRVVLDRKQIHSITEGLYGGIAREFNTTPCRVERGIRHLVESAYLRGNVDELERCIGYANGHTGKHTNGEFIANFARYIRYKFYS